MTETKIKKLPELKKIVFLLKGKKKKIIFTNGCFDILHYGHLRYLEAAKCLGDVLIVAVNSDSSVKRIKGENRPLNSQKQRMALVAGLACVDYCLSFKEDTPYRLIKVLKPDVLVKGGDWKSSHIVGSNFVKSHGGKVKTIKLIPGYSTTCLIKKIHEIEKP
jgi:D-beta-D-heptose 7-phosphate kinase/D-beta-D-heptose 1-phosphate adenosyltransferase